MKPNKSLSVELVAEPRPESLTITEVAMLRLLAQTGLPAQSFHDAWLKYEEEDLPLVVCAHAAEKLLAKPDAESYLKAVVERMSELGIAGPYEIQAFFTAVLRTPISKVDRKHLLCQKYTRTTHRNKDGTETVKEVFEMPPKHQAAVELAKIQGLYAPKKVTIDSPYGVMLLPETTDDLGDWEKRASPSQKKLVEDTQEV